MNIIDQFTATAQKNPARLVYPEASDPRILKAVVQVQELNIAHPILIGNPEQIHTLAKEHNCDLDGIEIIDSKSDSRLDTYSQSMRKNEISAWPSLKSWCANRSPLVE